jgi:hypothetical protein
VRQTVLGYEDWLEYAFGRAWFFDHAIGGQPTTKDALNGLASSYKTRGTGSGVINMPL